MKTTAILTFLLLSFSLFSQQIQILDLETKESIPFVKIEPNIGNAYYADIDGFFTPVTGASSVTLHMSLYADTTIVLNGQTLIYLRSLDNAIDEIVILPGVNKAERIMDKAIENRKINHPKSDLSYKFRSYSKFMFTMNQDALSAIPDNTTDTNLRDLKSFFDKQHLMVLENTTEKYFKPPFREKEIITAYKVSGFTDPTFSTFASELQTFNFYENNFDLLGTSYINPLAFGGIRRYLFILEDSTVNAPGDTTYVIRFQPRRDKNFNGMKGTMYINTKGYALEKVIAQPADSVNNVQAKIIQEYAYLDGKKWFPYKLSTEAIFPGLNLSADLKDAYLVGKGSTYIEDIQLGIDLSEERFNAATVQTANDANSKDATHWDNNRKYQLNEKELTTYSTIDSLSKAENLETKLNLLTSVLEGKIPLGYVQLDLLRLIDYREYEGYRLGMGLETSKKLMKRAKVGGYFGYGFRDKGWKYGAYGSVQLIPSHFVTLQARYQQDLIERGGVEFLSEQGGLNLSFLPQHFYVLNMEKQRLGEIALSGYVTPNVRLLVAGSYQRIAFTQGYNWSSVDCTINANDPFEVAETSAELSWTIREKVKYLGDRRISLGSKWPKITAKYTHSITGLGKSDLNYQRINLVVQQIVPLRAVGKLVYKIEAGKSLGELPLYLTNVARGTGGQWNLSIPNSFETMRASSFYGTEQLSIFTRFALKSFKTNLKWTAPQISVHHAMGTGNFKNATEHSVPVKSMNKGYYEAGLIFNDLLKLNGIGLGIGAFYNYGAYALPQAEKNITLKIGLTVNLN